MLKFYLKWVFIHCGWNLVKMEYAVISAFYLCIFPIVCLLFSKKMEQFMTYCSVIFIFVVGLAFFLIDGFFVRGYLYPTITIKNKLIDSTIIKITFGDIFSKKGISVVAVNEFFDNTVSSKPNAQVAENSLHGIMLSRYWKCNPDDWYSQIIKSVDKKHVATIDRGANCQCDRFPIGTTGIAISGEKQFICVVLSHTDLVTLMAKADLNDFRLAIGGALKRGREICSGRPLIFPLIGGFLSRTGIPKFMLLNLLLLEIFNASKEALITSEIQIVLPFNEFSLFNIATIKKEWERV